MNIILTKSNRKGKRMAVEFPDGKKIHFGSDVGSTFIDHNNKDKKNAWIARHKKGNPDVWDDIKSPLYWSRMILWNTKEIPKKIKNYNIINNI